MSNPTTTEGPTVRVTGVCTSLSVEKRCYLPGITLHSACPVCGLEHTQDLGESYLSYGLTDVRWYCEGMKRAPSGEWEDYGCSHHWQTLLRAEVRLYPAPPKQEDHTHDDTPGPDGWVQREG